MVLLSLTTVVLLAPAPATAPAGAGWRLPVDDAEVVGGFRVTPGAPFAAGQRRGIDLRVRPGTTVRAACTGRVTFAGRVPAAPARSALGVTVRCTGRPALVATHLGLGMLRVRSSAAVVRGATLGFAGRRGTVRLGARRAGERRGYLDPLALLGAAAGPAPLAPPPGVPGRDPRRLRPPPAPRPVPVRVVEPRPATTPPLAWVGLALIAAAPPLTLAAATRRRRGRRRAAGSAAAAAPVVR